MVVRDRVGVENSPTFEVRSLADTFDHQLALCCPPFQGKLPCILPRGWSETVWAMVPTPYPQNEPLTTCESNAHTILYH